MESLELRYTWQHVISKWWASSGSCVGGMEVQVGWYWLGSPLSYWKKKPGLFLYSAWDIVRKEWFCRWVPSASQKELNGSVLIALENIGWEMCSLGEEMEKSALYMWTSSLLNVSRILGVGILEKARTEGLCIWEWARSMPLKMCVCSHF